MTHDEAVARVLLSMTTLFPAPTHLREGRDAIALALDTYRRALSRYDAQTLERGWQAAAEANEIWCWPPLRDIIAACEKAAPRRARKDEGNWAEEAQAMADAYVKRFMATSAHAGRCEAVPLRDYAQACAWVQAQYLLGRKDVSYQSGVIFQLGEDAAEREAWFEAARRQAAAGRIAVRVPLRLAEGWRAPGEGRAR